MTSLDAALTTAMAAALPDEDGRRDDVRTGGAVDREHRLIERIRRGDERAFAQLVRVYQDRVFSLCLRMLGDRAEAEDLVQEIFVAVHAHLAGFRAEASLSTWIYRVSRNRCLNRLKYLGRRGHGLTSTLEGVGDARLADAAGRAPVRPDHHLEGRELQSVLERALLALSEEQRLMVILRDVDGLAYDEIATICEVPGGTVKSRLHRARVALAEAVERYRSDGAPAVAAAGSER